MYEYNSFIELNDYGGYVVITNSKFINMNSCGSIIRNTRTYQYSNAGLATSTLADFYKYRANNYYNTLNSYKYTAGYGFPTVDPYPSCSKAASASAPCWSITITGSTFQSIDSMKTPSSYARFVSSTYNLRYYGTVLSLSNFLGHVQLNGNTFTNNIL